MVGTNNFCVMKNYPKLGKPLAVGYLADITTLQVLLYHPDILSPILFQAQVSPGLCDRSIWWSPSGSPGGRQWWSRLGWGVTPAA